jgi:8-oxo-dGTP pyrophosphatase MutT (NUDIX family)
MLPPRPIVRVAMTAIQQVRRTLWFVTRPRAYGVHAVALSASGKIILVRHSYARGWRLPGGGIKSGEDPAEAILRELEEEIGLRSWREMRHVRDFTHRPDFRRGEGSLFRLEGVIFTPRRSLEIEAIAEFDPELLPPEATPFTREMIAEALAYGEEIHAQELGIAGKSGEA